MKKHSVFLAMPVFALVFGLTFVSCWTTPSVDEPTQFEGRWLDQIAVGEFGYTDLSYIITGNTFVLKILSNQGYLVDYTYAGTFKYTKNRIQFTSENKTWVQEYTLTGSELNLLKNKPPNSLREAARLAPVAGIFTKQ